MFKAFEKYKNELEGVEEETENETPFVEKEEIIETENEEINSNDVVFKVQIETSEKKIPLTSTKFKGYTVSEYTQNGLFKYTVGNSVNDFQKANNMKKKLRESGFQHAFVVGFLNGERINLQKSY